MSRSNAPQVLERAGIERAATGDDDVAGVVELVDVDDAPAGTAEPAPSGRRVTGVGAFSVPRLPAGVPLAGILAGRRLPHPPGRRAPLWFAALVAGALFAMLPSLLGSPVAVTDASDYGLGAGAEGSLTGGLDDAGVRRSITEAEAQARLSELAASRAAREPKTVVPVTSYRLTTCFCMRWGQMHPGWDLAAPLGTPILAATDGVVLKAGRESGYGNAVFIQDADGNVHLYGHMRYFDVEAGQVVSAGDQIAKIGNEGFSTGPHLHWQIHRGGIDGRPMDPKDWLAEHGVNT